MRKASGRASDSELARGGFLKIISIGVTTYAGMKTGF